VSVDLDDLVAPPPRERFREELWERAQLHDRRVARRWRALAIVAAALAGAALGAAGVLAFGQGEKLTGATTYDRTLSCPMAIQGGVPVARLSAHPRYSFFNNGQNFTMVAYTGVMDKNGQGYAGLGAVRGSYGFAMPSLCTAAKRVPLDPAGLPLYDVYTSGQAGLGAMDNGAQCLVGARATMRVYASIGRNDTPVSGRLALWTGAKKPRPVAFVQWTPKRVAVYMSDDCHVP
jgi:hypothetical protein